MNYTVYVHKVNTDENGTMYYVGMTSDIKVRWLASHYRQTTLRPYIEKYGWENIEHIVIRRDLDKESAAKLEDELICKYRADNCCINFQRSGFIQSKDPKSYLLNYRKENKEHIAELNSEYQSKHCDELKLYWKKYRIENREKILRYDRYRYRRDKEKRNEYNRQKRSTPEGKIYNRVSAFNHRHPDKATETPAEAKRKYLETGYIPTYIKNNDLI